MESPSTALAEIPCMVTKPKNNVKRSPIDHLNSPCKKETNLSSLMLFERLPTIEKTIENMKTGIRK